MKEVHGGSFSVGSGDSNDEEVFRRVFIKGICELCSVFFVRLIEKTVLDEGVESIIGDEFFEECLHEDFGRLNQKISEEGICPVQESNLSHNLRRIVSYPLNERSSVSYYIQVVLKKQEKKAK